MAVVLDTTVLIDALRGRPAGDRMRDLLDAGETMMTTAINVEEVFRGLRESERVAAEGLFRGLHVLSVRAEDGERAGRWRGDSARRGVTLHQADCLIAAVATAARARLATANVKDFPMPGLAVEEWPIGL